MILPNKHLKLDRTILGVSAEILSLIGAEATVSELWERIHARRRKSGAPINFDWFILSLSFLYAVGAISIREGVLIQGGDSNDSVN